MMVEQNTILFVDDENARGDMSGPEVVPRKCIRRRSKKVPQIADVPSLLLIRRFVARELIEKYSHAIHQCDGNQ